MYFVDCKKNTANENSSVRKTKQNILMLRTSLYGSISKAKKRTRDKVFLYLVLESMNVTTHKEVIWITCLKLHNKT